MADTKVAMLASVLLSSAAGAAAGAGEVSGGDSSGRALLTSPTSGAGVGGFSACGRSGAAPLTGGRSGLRGFPGGSAGSVPNKPRAGAVLVVNAVAALAVVVLKALGCWVETLPGAGGAAVLRAFSGVLPTGGWGGGETVLVSLWEVVGFLPEKGAGAVLTELGLEVVVFLDGAVFAVDVGPEIFLARFGGARGGSGLFFPELGLEAEMDFA